ncbi:MAG: molybdopterin-dependent oxidoreductase [Actinobacteria bacterium]|nr:molybdopterin-dependent oxidoreductase [Actinomycetota bacterium]
MDSRRNKLKGGLLGVLATLVGLSLGNAMAGLHHTWNNPIVSLGNRVVDHVPSAIKEFAIRTFGVNDKAFLISTIVIVVIGLSFYIGRTYFSERELTAQAIVTGMTVAASIAALFDPHSTLFSILPSVTTGLATFFTLRWMSEQLQTSPEADSGRRDLFRVVGVAGVATLAATGLGKILQQHASVQVERIKQFLPKAMKFLPKPPLDPALRTPGLSSLFTPNEKFYRIDTALSTPNISIETWKLEIDGMVSNPKTFTYAELMKRETFELDDTISCVSNEVGGNLVGNARWYGIRLDDLIRESKPTSRADQVMGHSTDGFTAGFPLAALDGRDAMIALGMNGEVLPIDHGYPARIIVPGLYGYVSATKWLTRIELTRFDEKQGYWIPRGWSAQAPIKTQSRIDTPFDGFTVKPGPRAIAGVAWAPTRGISKVEVKIGKEPWREATLGPELAKTTWRQWWIDWSPTSGHYQISLVSHIWSLSNFCASNGWDW